MPCPILAAWVKSKAAETQQEQIVLTEVNEARGWGWGAEWAGRDVGESSARFSFVCECCVTVSSEIDTFYPLGKLFKPGGKIFTTAKGSP